MRLLLPLATMLLLAGAAQGTGLHCDDPLWVRMAAQCCPVVAKPCGDLRPSCAKWRIHRNAKGQVVSTVCKRWASVTVVPASPSAP